jgi:hypothetical protein
MAYGYSPRPDSPGCSGQESVAYFPGSLFKGAFSFSPVGRHVLAIDCDGNAQRASQIRYIFSISLGFVSPQLMIKVSYMKFDP